MTFNYTLVKNLRESRYKGDLYLIHPKTDEIVGIPAYNTLEEIGKTPELAIIMLSSQIPKIVSRLADFGIKHCMIESDFTNEPDAPKIFSKLTSIASEKDVLILGPAMIGIINTENYFTSSVIPVRRHIIHKHRRYSESGSLSFLAQSGGLSGALGWWTPLQNIPISKVIHTGKSINVKDADILEYLFKDKSTTVISLYLRIITEDIVRVLKEHQYEKPVLFKYVGKENGLIRELEKCAIKVDNYIELFEFAKIFLWCPEPMGKSLGIIGPSSGAIHLLISEMRNQGLHLARVNPQTKDTILEKVGGSTCLAGNPVDYWPPEKFIGTDVCRIYFDSSHLLLKDEKVDALFLALEFFSEIEFDFDIFNTIKQKYPDKPIITILIQAESEGRKRIIGCASELHIPVFVDEVERAIRGYSALIKYYENKREATSK